jgi:plastocyanin
MTATRRPRALSAAIIPRRRYPLRIWSVQTTRLLLGVLITALPAVSLAQVGNEITAISPDSATQGAASVTISFTLDSDTPLPPPANVPVDTVSIGTVAGTSVTRTSQYVLSAVFSFPSSEAAGAKAATVGFTTPQGSLVFSSSGLFTLNAGAETPATIAEHPQSRAVSAGSSVTFSVSAWGTAPLSYQWQRDAVDIPGADDSTLTIAAVTGEDEGEYRCIVSNAFGTDTSEAAALELALTPPFTGYNLFAPMTSTQTYLMDNDGQVVHSWSSAYRPGLSVYLLEDGSLLRTANVNNSTFSAGGSGGRVERYSWDGDLLWNFDYSSADHCQHHDIEPLPNGNILMIVWEKKTSAEAIAAGRNPDQLNAGELWPDSIVEIEPVGTSDANIVWEWHVWDHLVQDHDAAKSNYGVVADQPRKIDINHMQQANADWTHTNSIDYNAELDQIVLSVHNFSEIWVIDHNTTTAQAVGNAGDLLYRWGNPKAYGAGTSADQQIFSQHDAEWISAGLPGAGSILIFDNGLARPAGDYSAIVEIVPPLQADGSYLLSTGIAYGPASPAWTYTANPTTDFYAERISGAQRLPNGNTLICEGTTGRFLEVTNSGQTVWGYANDGEVFRVDRYGKDYPGFANTALVSEGNYPIVDTGQVICYNASSAISAPAADAPFHGQDGQVDGNQPSYVVSADGLSVHDNVTGLIWTQSPDWDGNGTINANDKFVFEDFLDYPDALNTANYGGYSDWRAPTIKELYSLIDFRGTDPNVEGTDTTGLIPFIETEVFDFGYGDTASGERVIDAQFWSSTEYVWTTMGGMATTFGVNFADGRIKGYGRSNPMGNGSMDQYALFVRGNTEYGINSFVDNGDGTITDQATDLMWAQADNGAGVNWEDALAWAQEKNAADHLGHSDWRLPNAKELQSIVDYTRSPDTTDSPAIDPAFACTQMTNEMGQADFGFYWSSTTHVGFDGNGGRGAYVAFGRGTGQMNGTAMDVHGAGCQRSDPKDGDPADYPVLGMGPQGDAQRVFNYVRLVRDVTADDEPQVQAPTIDAHPQALTVDPGTTIHFAVTASGTAPLSYQWQKDGADIAGATSTSYDIASAQESDEGAYRCVVSNSTGNVTSDSASLSVNAPQAQAPTIDAHPQALTVGPGTEVRFTVTASGTAPLSYQWQKDGADIAGATSADYDIASAQESDEGAFRCVVSNATGSATSGTAALVVREVAEWQMAIALVGAATRAVEFGVDSEATDGLDLAFDEPAPPSPVTDSAPVAFLAPGSATALVRDIRGQLLQTEWQLAVNAANSSNVVELSWSANDLPSPDMRLWTLSGRNGSPLAGTGRNMAETTALVVPAGTVAYLAIELNEAPTADNAGLSIPEDSATNAVVGTVPAEDPDRGDSLAYEITAGNHDGTFTIDTATGQITVAEGAALDHESVATWTLTVTVVDRGGLSDSATVTVAITDINEPPRALPEEYAVNNSDLLVHTPGVLANDTDPEQDTLSAVLLADVEHGTLNLGEDGAFTYVPTPGFRGTDEFSYAANDGSNTSDSTRVTILVYDGWLVTVEADAAGQPAGSVQFGIVAGATREFDDGIDTIAPDGAPLSLLGPEGLGHDLQRDALGSLAEGDWVLIVTPGDTDLTLTWAPESIPAHGLVLEQVSQDDTRAEPVALAMEEIGELTVPAGYPAAFRVSAPLVHVQLNLVAGWNLISLPIAPIDPALDALFEGMPHTGTAWAWDPDGARGLGTYVGTSVLEPLMGYWVYVTEPGTATVIGFPLSDTEVPLAAGWNLVGVPEEMVLPRHPALFGPGWSWDGHVYRAARVGDTLIPGAGYWFNSVAESVLNPQTP